MTINIVKETKPNTLDTIKELRKCKLKLNKLVFDHTLKDKLLACNVLLIQFMLFVKNKKKEKE